MKSGAVWLGYSPTGERVDLWLSESRSAVVLGDGSTVLAAQTALSAHRGGWRVAVIDLEGEATRRLSGHIAAHDGNAVVGDSTRFSVPGEGRHPELVASAYSEALDLAASEEQVLEAAVSQLYLEDGTASPAAIADVVGTVTGFRAQLKQDVEGKLSLLRLLDRPSEPGRVEDMAGTSFTADFSRLPSHGLAEGASLLFLAKLLCLDAPPEVIVVTEAHRLFKDDRARPCRRLLLGLLSAPASRVLSTDFPSLLDPLIVKSSTTRVTSSAVWNQSPRVQRVIHGSFVLMDLAHGSQTHFVPLGFDHRAGVLKEGPARPEPGEQLSHLVLRTIAEGPPSTRSSIVGFLSAGLDRGDVERCVDRLLADGSVTRYRESRDSARYILGLSEVGRKTLTEAAGHE